VVPRSLQVDPRRARACKEPRSAAAAEARGAVMCLMHRAFLRSGKSVFQSAHGRGGGKEKKDG